MAMARLANITVFKKHGGALSKRLHLNANGTLENDSSECRMAVGTAISAALNSIEDFADYIASFPSDVALALGSLKEELAQDETIAVVTKRRLRAGTSVGAISRSQDFIEYRKGAPGLILLDFDTKGMPPDVKQRLADIGGFRSAVESLVPSLRDAATAMRASTSSGLTRTDTGADLPGSSGVHLYVSVSDVSDSARFLKALHARAWLAGLGWYFVGAAGQLLERSIVDRMVGQPERLVFEGAPVLEPPLAQDQRRCAVTSGGMLDTLSACPELDAGEQARVDQMLTAARHALRPAREKGSREFVTHKTDTLTKRGIAPAAARKVALSWSRGTLLPAVVLEFDDPELVGITVGDVLADPKTYLGETLADPLEGIDYGPCKAMIMQRADGSLFIHSFAHGRGIYELRLDEATVRAAVEKHLADGMNGAAVVAAFVAMLCLADIEPAEACLLVDMVSKRTKIGKKPIKDQLKTARTEAQQKLLNEWRERRLALRTDPRPQRAAPYPDAPWIPEMEAYDAILGAARCAIPPSRHIEDELNCARCAAVPGTHAASSDGKGGPGEGGDEDTPPVWSIRKLNGCEAADLLERHIDFVDPEDGHSVHCPGAFVQHYMQWSASSLPKLVAITQLPLLLGNGDILTLSTNPSTAGTRGD
jgi:hypothetical protein